MELHLQQTFSPFPQNRSGKRRIWGIITGGFGYARGNWAPSGGLGWQVGTMQATGWGGGQPWKSEGSPSVMEGMRDEGLSPVWLPLDTGITSRGWNSWSQPQTTNYSWGLLPGARATPVGLTPGGVLGLAVGWRVGCQFNGATAAPSGGSVPAPGACSGQTGVPGRPSCLSAGRKSAGAGPSSSQAAEAAGRSQMMGPQTGDVLLLCLCFQARKPVRLLFQPFQWWTDTSNDSHTLVQLPCCFAGTSLDIPCSIWGIFNTRELAYQLHMYQIDPLTIKNL